MLGDGTYPTEFSYATILRSCSKLSSLPRGRQVHAQTIKDGYVDHVFVGIAIIDMYSRCGNVDGARQVFDIMPSKSTVTWNEMIHGHDSIGREKPDDITFVAVLTSCSHSGLVDQGLRIFNSMQKYGSEPLLEHYTCIIDSLGHAGRFQEVEAVLDKMPYNDDPVVVHANVSLAKRAAEELFLLDPQNSAPYVLLANMYSSLGRWDDAKDVRKMMVAKQIIKDPGYSWVEHKNELQASALDDNIRAAGGKS
ncbi:hypothetical protein RJ639_001227 [Escallonia herrerae]|uniref:Pentatricopeptide repeat-containing protein n=1 Tax=Escallonia herrerae TaxID=1293975 RepID=A0AA88X914_9ASTE|nr:hypothetical protein RJ639_001227 [Escallonia herrerae]